MFIKKRITWKLAMLAALSSSLFISSCRDDEAPSIDGDPTVKVTTSATSDVVWNTVTLNIEANDDKKIAKIEVKVDNTVVDTQTSSPFDFKWDTQKIDDGAHTVTVTASDEAGQQASWTATLKVQNILLEFDVPDDLLGEGNRGFVFLSDSEGKVIVSTEYENGDPTIKLRAPDYNGKDFTVTEAFVSEGEGTYGSFNTIAEVPRGKWMLSRYDEGGEGEIGEARLTFTNFEDGFYYNFSSNGGWTQAGGAESQPGVWLRKDPSKLLITKNPNSGTPTWQYGVVPSIKVGNNEIDLSAVNKTLTEETLALPAGYNDGYIDIYAIATAGNYEERYWVGGYYDQSTDDITVRYPGNDFAGYFSHNESWAGESMKAENYHKGVYNLTPLAASINVSVNGEQLTGNVSGTLDYYVAVLSFDRIYWEIVSAKEKSVVIPEIPTEIEDLLGEANISEAYSIDVVAIDLETVTNYADLVSQITTSAYGYYDFYIKVGHNDKKLIKYLLGGKGGRKKGTDIEKKFNRRSASAGRSVKKQ
jgi:hypothetical protein